MEVIQKNDIKVPNAVLISGITETDLDEDILDLLKRYGAVNRLICFNDPNSVSGKSLIVEYKSGKAVLDLQSLLGLPHTQEFGSDPTVTYTVVALASVYTKKAGKDATQTYLDEIKAIAKSGGKGYAEVLKDMLTQISKTLTTESLESDTDEEAEATHDIVTTSISSRTSQNALPRMRVPVSPPFSRNDLNPPDVQKVVVEHIVRNNDLMTHRLRLRTFSGRTPRPSNEVNYDTWRASVELLLQDPAVSDLQRVRRICDSLYSPASDIIKSVNPGSPPTDYVKLLDSAFSTMEDGDELFAKFMSIFQNTGEKPSEYIQRLQVALNLTMKRGGVQPPDVNKHRLKQFCRGCWDDTLITELQLEQKKQDPPSFTELLALLRTKENKTDSKATRMKQHLGVVKQHAAVKSQISYSCKEEDVSQLSSVTAKLTKQVAELQSQLATLAEEKHTSRAKPSSFKPQKEKNDTKAEAESKLKVTNKQHTVKPRPWYCFKCGEDGHIATSCSNDPDPTLVADKRKQLQKRQREWESQNVSSDLN